MSEPQTAPPPTFLLLTQDMLLSYRLMVLLMFFRWSSDTTEHTAEVMRLIFVR